MNIRPDPGWAYKWGLVSHWPLNEGSGGARDLHGTNHLAAAFTGTAGPTANVGHINPMARQFTAANDQYFAIDSNSSLQTGDIDFWMSAWVFLDSNTQGIVFGKWSNPYEYVLYYSGGDQKFSMFIQGSGADFTGVLATVPNPPSLSTWYFLLSWHDSVADTINISVNNGTVYSAAHTAGGLSSTSSVRIGKDEGSLFDGRIESISFGKSPPGGIASRIGEIGTVLYNGGLGSPFPFGGSPA